MALYQVSWNPTTKTATIAVDGTAVPGGSTKVYTFNHVNDPLDQAGPDVNHVIFKHVQRALYSLDQWNMQEVTIVAPAKLIAVQAITLLDQVRSVTVGKHVRLKWEIKPKNADNLGVTFASNNTGVATVDANGRVLGVAPGQAQITLTSAEGNKTIVAYVTVVP